MAKAESMVDAAEKSGDREAEMWETLRWYLRELLVVLVVLLGASAVLLWAVFAGIESEAWRLAGVVVLLAVCWWMLGVLWGVLRGLGRLLRVLLAERGAPW